MNLDSVIASMQRSLPECVAVGVVDMTTGMLLAVKTVESYSQAVLDRMATAAEDVLEGPGSSAVAGLFGRVRKRDDGPYVHEVVMVSDDLVHVFLRGRARDDVALVTVCRASANLGMVLSRSRLALPAVEASLGAQ